MDSKTRQMLEGLAWVVPPVCQGQIVEVAYASDRECSLYRRTFDRSDRTTSYERADLDDLEGEFEPWNGEPDVVGWESMDDQCECECGCDAPATHRDEGVPLCDECGSYTYDGDGLFIGCGRSGLGETCPTCDQRIEWGSIQTGSPGQANRREGECQCGQVWTETEQGPGNSWQVSRA